MAIIKNMKDLDFPIFKTKSDPSPAGSGQAKKFDLTDVNDRQAYFEYKSGPEIKKLREYLKTNTFVAYLLGKKEPMLKCWLKSLTKTKLRIFPLATW